MPAQLRFAHVVLIKLIEVAVFNEVRPLLFRSAAAQVGMHDTIRHVYAPLPMPTATIRLLYLSARVSTSILL